jgi:hypothetical protein
MSNESNEQSCDQTPRRGEERRISFRLTTDDRDGFSLISDRLYGRDSRPLAIFVGLKLVEVLLKSDRKFPLVVFQGQDDGSCQVPNVWQMLEGDLKFSSETRLTSSLVVRCINGTTDLLNDILDFVGDVFGDRINQSVVLRTAVSCINHFGITLNSGGKICQQLSDGSLSTLATGLAILEPKSVIQVENRALRYVAVLVADWSRHLKTPLPEPVCSELKECFEEVRDFSKTLPDGQMKLCNLMTIKRPESKFWQQLQRYIDKTDLQSGANAISGGPSRLQRIESRLAVDPMETATGSLKGGEVRQ